MKQHQSNAGRSRHLTRAALAAALVAATACGAAGGRDDYAQDGDTGAAAPATEGGYDQSTAKMGAGDTSRGTQRRTGTPGVAGDTMGQVGEPAGRTDSATRATLQQHGNRPIPRPATPTPPPQR